MITRNSAWIIALFLLVLTLVGCKEDPEADLFVFPESIAFHEADTAEVFLFLQPAIKGKWNITSKPDWLHIEPSYGDFRGDTVMVKVSVDFQLKNSDTSVGEVEFVSNTNGSAILNAEVIHDMTAKLEIKPRVFHFDESESEQVIHFYNRGHSMVFWQIENDLPWIRFNPLKGNQASGSEREVKVSVVRDGFPPGTQSGKAMVNFNAEDGIIELEFSMDVPPVVTLEVKEDFLPIGYFEEQKSFYLYNTGNVPGLITFQSPVDYLTIATQGIELVNGDSVEVTLVIDRSALETGVFNFDISIAGNEEYGIEVPVKVYNYVEEKWMIDGLVKDVAYDRTNDVLIMVTDEPMMLQKYNPATGTVQSVSLNQPPRRLSVDASGNYAVVSYQYGFSYINLSTMQIEQEYPVSTSIGRILLAPNQWVYAIPTTSNERIRCIYLPNGNETQHTGSNHSVGIATRLHPSGDALYRLTAYRMERFDITSGTAALMWYTPPNHSYKPARNIWIPESGDIIIGENRRIFRSSDNPDIDLTYYGRMEGEGIILDFNSHDGINKSYATFEISIWPAPAMRNIVRSYDNTYMVLEETFELTDFLIPDGHGHGEFVASEGYYIFLSASGTTLFVVARNSMKESDWAIITMEL